MKKIEVKNKEQIKQLLYAGHILGIKDEQYHSFGGFQRWWYVKELDTCHSCKSHGPDGKEKTHGADGKEKIESCSLDKTAKILWHNHNTLFMYDEDTPNENQ